MSEEDLLLYKRGGRTAVALGEMRLMVLCFGWGSLGGTERCLSPSPSTMEPVPTEKDEGEEGYREVMGGREEGTREGGDVVGKWELKENRGENEERGKDERESGEGREEGAGRGAMMHRNFY